MLNYAKIIIFSMPLIISISISSMASVVDSAVDSAVERTANSAKYGQGIVENKMTKAQCIKKKDHIWDESVKRCIHVPRGSF